MNGTAIKFDIVLDGGQAETGPLFLGGVIRLENSFLLIGRNAWSIVANRNLDDVIRAAAGPDEDISGVAIECIAGVLKDIDKSFRNMTAQHQQRRKLGSVIPMDADPVAGRSGGFLT